jgi:CDP-6-deoxy-D-xylo-4-hexulose-3-dehydrase
VAGNFAKNPVMGHFDFDLHGNMKNAEYIDANGLFIGNHHYSISDAIEELATYNRGTPA